MLAVPLRLVQGCAPGGETGPSTASMLAGAPAHRRGPYVVLRKMSADDAAMIAGLFGAEYALVA